MMRKLFRAWDGKIMHHNVVVIDGEAYIRDSFATMVKAGDYLMQFVGLQDKEGVDVYEGDIVYIPDLATIGYKHEVVFHRGSFGFFEFRDSAELWSIGNLHPDDIEIIGNIYENPELI